MLYLKKNISDKAVFGVWKIEEPETELISLINDMDLTDRIKAENPLPKRFAERLSIQVLLKTLTGENHVIHHHANGKPYIRNHPFYISISHTKNYVALILNESEETGVDIEQISDKVTRVKSKFLSADEENDIDGSYETIHLLLYWSAKETLYKAIGSEGINLKKDLIIQKFSPRNSGSFLANEFKTANKTLYKLDYIVEKEFVLTWINQRL